MVAALLLTATASLAEAVTADLIVTGTFGRTGIPGLIIGNTAGNVLETTSASAVHRCLRRRRAGSYHPPR